MVLMYLIITSAPDEGNTVRILFCVLVLVKSHLENIVAPSMSSMSLVYKISNKNGRGSHIIWPNREYINGILTIHRGIENWFTLSVV